MSGAWLETLRSGGVVLLDGGTGSELRRRGVPLDPEAWSGPASLTHAEVLEGIHADYLRAGADVITTNTFGANRFVLAAAGWQDRFSAVNRAAVEAAVRARERVGREAAIAGSISCLPPGFDPARYPEPAAERAAYAEQAALLAELGVDLLVLEMMEDTVHARRACEAVSQLGLPFWLGVSCRFDAARRRLVAYDFPETDLGEILDALLDYAPGAVNVMHTPVDAMAPALAAVAEKWGGVLGAYPELEEGSEALAESPARLADLARSWVAGGVRIVGGCCGTGPEHIRAMEEEGKKKKGSEPFFR